MAEPPKLNFAAKLAEMQQRAAGPAANVPTTDPGPRPQPAYPVNPNTAYFHSSHKAFTFLDHKDQKKRFENHFFITNDKELANFIRKEFVKKGSGSLEVREVNHFFYDQSQLIRPIIEPLPAITAENPVPPEPQPLPVSIEKAAPNT